MDEEFLYFCFSSFPVLEKMLSRSPVMFAEVHSDSRVYRETGDLHSY